MASWILDEFDPLSNGSRGEQVGGSGLDELQILAQDASGTG